jgi:peptide/nickel transport system ATP-binding protein
MSAPIADPTTTGSAPLLRVDDLHVTFSSKAKLLGRGRAPVVARAVDGVSLDLAEGEILALAGESGCGKTSLARAVMGFVRPTSGRVLYEGEPPRDLRAYRRHVQMIYQDPTGALNPRQTVYDSVVEGLRIHRIAGDKEAMVASALSRAGLRPPERFFLLFPHELSGGQRQRVVIAGALALEPRVIIADEPVSNLDASVRGEILRLLLHLRETAKISILIVTHDLGLAWTIADRVAVMYLGRIVELGPTRDVLTTPMHPYTRALLNVVPEADGIDRRLLSGEPPDPTQIPEGCRFHPRCPALADGDAAAAGVDGSCRSLDPALTPTLKRGADGVDANRTTPHLAACHLTETTGRPLR